LQGVCAVFSAAKAPEGFVLASSSRSINSAQHAVAFDILAAGPLHGLPLLMCVCVLQGASIMTLLPAGGVPYGVAVTGPGADVVLVTGGQQQQQQQ
jgi:hypothetical protein